MRQLMPESFHTSDEVYLHNTNLDWLLTLIYNHVYPAHWPFTDNSSENNTFSVQANTPLNNITARIDLAVKSIITHLLL